jgi:hypothetical protein
MSNHHRELWIKAGSVVLFGVGTLSGAPGCSEHKIAIYEEPPTVAILEPSDSDVFLEGVQIAFKVRLDDTDDGVESLDVQVRSDLEGTVSGEGTLGEREFNFVSDGLSGGTHTIKVEATDPDGKTGQDSVEIAIVPNTAPWVVFTSPEEGTVVGDHTGFLVAIESGDTEEAATSLRLTWSIDSVPFGAGATHPSADGRASAEVDSLEAGTHMVEVLIMDTQGATSTAQIEIVVIEGDDDEDGYYSVEIGGEDCDDTDPSINPDAVEICDGVDNDCDDKTDAEDPDLIDGITGHVDRDGDGFGDADTIITCDPSEIIADGSDCDDTDPSINPDATEVCDSIDNDCDALVDGMDPDTDGDGDGFSGCADDCADDNDAIHPDADEICDGIDNNCDGAIDGPSAIDAGTYFPDADGDGYGDADSPMVDCTRPTGAIDDGTDCNDATDAAHPGALEICDGIDNDCDTLVDGHDTDTDTDSDGFSACDDDCVDSDADIHPDADEICDEIDNDCDTVIDGASAIDALNWFADVDGDGFGDPDTFVRGCTIPTGASTDDTDCDDAHASAHPGAMEICDEIDNDCDTLIDGDDPDTDLDGDGFSTCENDCDDDDPDIHPDAMEICDGLDNDCDDTVDGTSATDATVFYRDADGDDHGTSDESTLACDAPEGFVDTDMDCNDGDHEIHPDAREVCDDGIDNDCDGLPGTCNWAGDMPIDEADRISYGEAEADEIGSSLAAGDITGDGVIDLIVGAAKADITGTNNGSVYLISGPLTETVGTIDYHADWRIDGNTSNDYLGGSVQVFDHDNDGQVDLIMSAIREDSAATDAGAVFIQYGPVLTDSMADDSDVTIVGETGGDSFGSAIASGDIDGDGIEDLIVGAYLQDEHEDEGGAAYLFLGDGSRWSGMIDARSFDTRWVSNERDMAMGASLNIPGDLNGDGSDDLLIGAPKNDDNANQAGAVFVVLGHTSELSLGATLLDSATHGRYRGAATMDRAGTSIASLGDVDGDGRIEFMIAAPHSDGEFGSDQGAVYGLLDPDLTGSHDLEDHSDFIFRGATERSQLGQSLNGNFDLNDDGFSDLVVGAAGESREFSWQGVGYLIYGSVLDFPRESFLPGAESAAFLGESSNDIAGTVVLAGPDLDGDGIDDMSIGAAKAQSSSGESSAGGIYTMFGRGL